MADEHETPADPAKASEAAVPPAGGEKDANAADKAKAAAGAAADAAKDFAKAGFGFLSKFGGKVGQKVSGVFIALVSLPMGLFRGSLAYRLVTIGFAASIVLLAITGTRLAQKYMPAPKHKKSEASVGFNAYMQQEKDYAIATSSLVFLEKFNTSVNSDKGHIRHLEIEVYIETDVPETARLIKTRMTDVREMVAGAIQEKSYEKLLTDDGMDAFKAGIRQAINRGLERWNLKGSVRRVFFTQFLMS